MRRLAIFVAIAFAAIGVAFAVLPFTNPLIRPETWREVGAESCSAPIVEAFRTDADKGWFGYSPLTSIPVPGCRTPAQRRLTYAGMFMLAAGVIVVALRREGGESLPPPRVVPRS